MQSCHQLHIPRLSPSSGTRLEDVLPSIQDICCAAAKAIPNPRNPVDKAAIEDFEEAGGQQ